MTRKEITKFLSNLLISEKFIGMGKYWAKEVTLNYGSDNVKRVDFMQFVPANTYSIGSIEKGHFICYEVKSCKADFESGFGKNFIAEENYFVMPMVLYKEICSNFLPYNIGALVPIPKDRDKFEEFENPTDLSIETEWKLVKIKASYLQERRYSIAELLFCMLRSGKN